MSNSEYQHKHQVFDAKIIELTDTIHSHKMPSFPGLSENPEITLLIAAEELPEQQCLDLLEYYCTVHGLDFPIEQPASETQTLPIDMPVPQPTLL